MHNFSVPPRPWLDEAATAPGLVHHLRKSRLFFLLFLVAILVAAHAEVASAGVRSAPLAFLPADGGRHIAQPVDWLTWCGDCVSTSYASESPWVTNPTTCMWDTDDWFEYSNSGSTLAPGASVRVNECSYESTSGVDPNMSLNTVVHAAYLDVTAPSPNLRIAETFSWSGGAHTVAPPAVWDATTKRYDYQACIVINGVANGSWVPVPNSDGGWGVPVSITAAVTNPTSRSVGSIGGVIQYGWQQFYAAGCQVPSPFPAPLS